MVDENIEVIDLEQEPVVPLPPKGMSKKELKKSKLVWTYVLAALFVIVIMAISSLATYQYFIKEKTVNCLDQGIIGITINNTPVTLILRGVNGTCYDVNNQSLQFNFAQEYRVLGADMNSHNETIKVVS